MDITLGHASALQCWRTLRRLHPVSSRFIEDTLPQPQPKLSFRSKPTDLTLLRRTYDIKGKLHAVISDDKLRHRHMNVMMHSWPDAVNAGDFVEVEPGVRLASPSICYMQLCRNLSLVDCVLLAYELCSRYVVDDAGKLREVPPLMSIAAARRTIESSTLQVKKTRALRALELAHENSRSPMETELAVKLGMPARFGGFGLSGFKMNSKVSFGELGRTLTSKEYCSPDLLWESCKLDVEYNGAEWHSGSEKMAEDMLRRQALTLEGYTVLTVDKGVIVNPQRMRELANEISLRVKGRRVRMRAATFESASRELYARFAAWGSHVRLPIEVAK